MAKVDFQEILNKEVMSKKADRNSELLIQILEEKLKEDSKSFLDEFNNILIKNIGKDNNIQNSVKEDLSKSKEKEADDDR